VAVAKVMMMTTTTTKKKKKKKCLCLQGYASLMGLCIYIFSYIWVMVIDIVIGYGH